MLYECVAFLINREIFIPNREIGRSGDREIGRSGDREIGRSGDVHYCIKSREISRQIGDLEAVYEAGNVFDSKVVDDLQVNLCVYS